MDFSLSGLWREMGLFARLVVIVMGVMSLTSLLVLGERLVMSFKSMSDSKVFAAKMASLLANGDLDAAADAKFGKDIGYLGRTIRSGLVAYKGSVHGDKDLCFESVARALERQQARELAVLKRGHGWLATVGSTAPFVGLLGTVMGIVTAFEKMAASGSGGLGTVSAGIAEALITTAFGLLVAIPAVMAFNFLAGWVDARAVDISESSNEFLDLVARRLAEGPREEEEEEGEESEAAA
ncbi:MULTISPECIES: MotA/TolQ/ExbB proton channel family protein [Polyangium]|uniref:MotA/TolQ/ExbB proton channel family protein n=2 Tax=Polyangium TaxID=55 RepID=A0A4U1JHW6_9BACT|nr:MULTISPECIES: MotA/TolQ/ExbB proton channel family protein [Polyangium]MDI1435259.1 MotA/TolQ/ExbB proton channel family protein [Polyangium sorediatum]TKD12025.1 MotA/TolQ/ExbB proton channel family protein [Polyangium fumosum]